MPGTWPADVKIENEKLESVFFTFVDRTNNGKRNARSGERHIWRMRLLTKLLPRAIWQKFFAFGVKQRGRFYTFTLPSSVLRAPLGVASGTPLVNGAHSAGDTTITTDGWTASVTGIMKAGDLLKFENHAKVYMVMEDANTDVAGGSTLTIEPALVADLADNEPVTVNDVPFTMAFAQDPLPLETDVNQYAKFDLELEEVWN